MTYLQFDEEQCKAFVRDSKSHYENLETTTPEIIQWKFMGFSLHPSFHLFIKDQDGLLNSGRAVLNTRTLNVFGTGNKITQVTDLLVIKSKASLITFIELIKNYGSLGTACVLHTSNENSEKIYSNFFKFKEVFELSGFAFPIRPQKLISYFKHHIFLSHIVSLYTLALFPIIKCIDWINPISITGVDNLNNVNHILEGFNNREISLLRSSEYLLWRYSNSPYAYKIYIVHSNKKSAGILVARVTTFNESKYFLVMDYISNASIGRWESLGLRLSIIAEAVAQKADAIFGLFNRKNKDLATFFKMPFISVDDKMLPHRSPIFISSIASPLTIADFEFMYFSMGDLDYF